MKKHKGRKILRSNAGAALASLVLAGFLVLFGGGGVMAQDMYESFIDPVYSDGSMVSSDGCFVYEVASYDMGDGSVIEFAVINAYGQTAIDTYEGADKDQLSASCPRNLVIPSEIDGVMVARLGPVFVKGSSVDSVKVKSPIEIGAQSFKSSSIKELTFEDELYFTDRDPHSRYSIVNSSLETITYKGQVFRAEDPIDERCFEVSDDGRMDRYHGFLEKDYMEDGINCMYRSHVDIPSTISGTTIVSIGDSAFAGTMIESVNIPNGVTSIGYGAFEMNSIKSVNLPASIERVEPDAFYLQSSVGRDFYEMFYEGDDQTKKELYESVYLTELVIEGGENPHNIRSATIPNRFLDINGNGVVDDDDYVVLGGHVVNSAKAKINYLDSSGGPVQPNKTVVGRLQDGKELSNFLVHNLPPLPAPEDPGDLTSEEIEAAISFADSVFFTAGHEFSYSAPTIRGMSPSPASFTGTLRSGVNEITFTYASSTGGGTGAPGGSSSGGSGAGGRGDGVSSGSQDGLAETGVNAWLPLVASLLGVVGASSLLIRRKTF